MSSRSAPAVSGTAHSSSPSASACGELAAQAAEDAGELGRVPQLLRGVRLAQPVGVEHERVAGLEIGEAVLELDPFDQAQQRPRHAGLAHLAVALQDQRQRVPAAGDRQADRRAREVEVDAGDRAEAVVGASRRSMTSLTQRRMAAGERRRTAAARIV
jgi:hypothetical protein